MKKSSQTMSRQKISITRQRQATNRLKISLSQVTQVENDLIRC